VYIWSKQTKKRKEMERRVESQNHWHHDPKKTKTKHKPKSPHPETTYIGIVIQGYESSDSLLLHQVRPVGDHDGAVNDREPILNKLRLLDEVTAQRDLPKVAGRGDPALERLVGRDEPHALVEEDELLVLVILLDERRRRIQHVARGDRDAERQGGPVSHKIPLRKVKGVAGVVEYAVDEDALVPGFRQRQRGRAVVVIQSVGDVSGLFVVKHPHGEIRTRNLIARLQQENKKKK
jgi:hypothetical protein